MRILRLLLGPILLLGSLLPAARAQSLLFEHLHTMLPSNDAGADSLALACLLHWCRLLVGEG